MGESRGAVGSVVLRVVLMLASRQYGGLLYRNCGPRVTLPTFVCWIGGCAFELCYRIFLTPALLRVGHCMYWMRRQFRGKTRSLVPCIPCQIGDAMYVILFIARDYLVLAKIDRVEACYRDEFVCLYKLAYGVFDGTSMIFYVSCNGSI